MELRKGLSLPMVCGQLPLFQLKLGIDPVIICQRDNLDFVLQLMEVYFNLEEVIRITRGYIREVLSLLSSRKPSKHINKASQSFLLKLCIKIQRSARSFTSGLILECCLGLSELGTSEVYVCITYGCDADQL